MKSEYKRDMNHNYLILHGEEEIDTTSYQVRMLVGNTIPTLLRCRVQGLDGKFMVYYDITSRQSISSLYEDKKFKTEDLRLIFSGFVQVMEDMSEYLLNPGNLVIRPEHMYLDIEKKILSFCYLPGTTEDVRQQFRTLTEYILPKLDHEDEGAVMLGYGVYRRALEDSFHLEHVKEELYQQREYAGKSVPKNSEPQIHTLEQEEFSPAYAKAPQADFEEGTPLFYREGFDDNKKRKKQEKRAVKHGKRIENQEKRTENREKNMEKQKVRGESLGMVKTILGFGMALLIFAGILVLKYKGYLPMISVEGILGAVLILTAAAMLVYLCCKKHSQKEKRSKEKTRSELPERYWENLEEEQEYESEEWGRDKRQKESEQKENRQKTGENEGSGYMKSYEVESEQRENGRDQSEKIQQESMIQNYGETVVLSASPVKGPASLVSREPGELAAIYIQEELTVIGKLETAADAVIDLPTVSRVHAKIRIREGEYYLSDLNSRNGTSVNGKMLKGGEEYLLQDQDEVDFAQARYVFLK